MNPARHIRVSIDQQRLALVQDGRPIREYPISTASRGTGFAAGSLRTPTGNFRIIDKIGHDAAPNTIFKGRVPAGTWQPGKNDNGDLILARILRLDGLDPENSNTRDRYIYIHGTNDTRHLGRPASHGCVRMAPSDIIDLFPMVNEGMEVVIEPKTVPKGKLFFIDCDSTLSAIEGIDELARARGPEVYEKVAAMTNAAMQGEVGLDEVFAKRIDLIRPDRAICEHVSNLYIERMVPGSKQLAADLRVAGWTPVILSGGFKPLIEPLARELGIEHVEAVPLMLDDDGNYAGYGASHPASQSMGKCAIIREWQEATLPTATVMMGDGASDLETRGCVDVFLCFTGVSDRPAVSSGADMVVHDMNELHSRMSYLDDIISLKINLASSSSQINARGDMPSKNIKTKKAKKATSASKAVKPAAKPTVKPAVKPAAPAAPAAKKAAPAVQEAKPAAKDNAVKGKRYSTAQKKEILQFIAEYDAKNGRGGQTQAAKKYGVTVLTLANWRKAAAKTAAAAPVPAPATTPVAASAPAPAAKPAAPAAAPKKRGRKPGVKAAAPSAPATAPAAAGGLHAKLSRLLELDKAISAAQAEVANLQKQFAALKATL